MTRARKTLIALDATWCYHIYVRAIRRSFLCGEDKVSGRNFDHRKQWLEDELLRLREIFAIDVRAFAGPGGRFEKTNTVISIPIRHLY